MCQVPNIQEKKKEQYSINQVFSSVLRASVDSFDLLIKIEVFILFPF